MLTTLISIYIGILVVSFMAPILLAISAYGIVILAKTVQWLWPYKVIVAWAIVSIGIALVRFGG